VPTNTPDPWAILLVDKLITGLVLLIGGWLLNRKLESFRSAQAQVLENFRSKQARDADARRAIEERHKEWSRETRTAVADLTTAIASCNQEMAWLTWRAQNHPHTIAQEVIDNYDAAVKPTLTNMFCARVRVAALDEGAHKSLTPCIDEIYRLDTAIARAATLLTEDAPSSVKSLGSIYAQSEALYNSLLKTVSEELKKLAIDRL
jgi:hypothetical protein